MRTLFSVILVALLGCVIGCEKWAKDESKYDAPADHTKKKKGAKHLPGLKDPLSNCVSCHGDSLQGGSVSSVSCYECHGQKWAGTSSDETSGDPTSNVPADHTVKKGNGQHKPGLKDASVNCTSCHGDNLQGGSGSSVSCFTCHGKKWK